MNVFDGHPLPTSLLLEPRHRIKLIYEKPHEAGGAEYICVLTVAFREASRFGLHGNRAVAKFLDRRLPGGGSVTLPIADE